MATYSVAIAKHPTLAANTVDQVTITGGGQADVEVLNRDPAADIYFTTDGSVPTVGGDNCYVVRAGQALQRSVPIAAATVVKLISASAAPYSVTGA